MRKRRALRRPTLVVFNKPNKNMKRRNKKSAYKTPGITLEQLAYEEVVCASNVNFARTGFEITVEDVTEINPVTEEGYSYFEF